MVNYWVPMALTDPASLNAIIFGGDQFGAMVNSQKNVHLHLLT
jgi:hypothetical protein